MESVNKFCLFIRFSLRNWNEKAKKLDIGDRYLNAKYAKKYVRLNNIEKSNEIMREFVKDPLHDDNIDHVQCMWYEIECAYAYLRENNILRAHRLFNSMIYHFTTIVEDQVKIICSFI